MASISGSVSAAAASARLRPTEAAMSVRTAGSFMRRRCWKWASNRARLSFTCEFGAVFAQGVDEQAVREAGVPHHRRGRIALTGVVERIARGLGSLRHAAARFGGLVGGAAILALDMRGAFLALFGHVRIELEGAEADGGADFAFHPLQRGFELVVPDHAPRAHGHRTRYRR
jgi:hypothetical protein